MSHFIWLIYNLLWVILYDSSAVKRLWSEVHCAVKVFPSNCSSLKLVATFKNYFSIFLENRQEMPGAIHKIPDPNNVIIRAVAQQIHRKRKVCGYTIVKNVEISYEIRFRVRIGFRVGLRVRFRVRFRVRLRVWYKVYIFGLKTYRVLKMLQLKIFSSWERVN